jgi:chitinase
MKAHHIFLSLAVLLSSCIHEVLTSEDPQAQSICATMEDIETKTNVMDYGSFTWSEGDKIWLQTTAGAASGTLSSGAGTADATFTYDPDGSGKLAGRAIYPYNGNHTATDSTLLVYLPSEYDLGADTRNTNAAMHAVISDGSLKFSHLAGVMRFKFRDVPAGTSQFKITTDKRINGAFKADLRESCPVLQTSETQNDCEKTITFGFDAQKSVSDLRIYVPLPAGTYESLQLELTDENGGTVWSYSKNVRNIIKRRSLLLMPTVTLSNPENPLISGSRNVIAGYAVHWEKTMPEPSLLTHINYAYAYLKDDCEGLDIMNSDRLRKIVALKSEFPHLRVLLTIGECSSENFMNMKASETHRANFCNNCLSAIQEYNLDGINLELKSPDESSNYLLKELRNLLGSSRTITITTDASAAEEDFSTAIQYLDFVSIMAYDMGTPPYHNAGLHPSSMTQGSCSESVELHNQAGIPYEKMVLGIPFYGRGNGVEYSTVQMDFKDVPKKELSKKGLVKNWDSVAMVPYLSNTSGEMVISYDDETSAGLKADYIVSKGLLGAMYWNLEADDYAWSLSKAVSSRLLDPHGDNSEECTFQVTNSYVQDFMDKVQYKDRDYSYTYIHDFPGGGPGRADLPPPVILKWKADPRAAVLKVWEEGWSREYQLTEGANSLEVVNLVPNIIYHYALMDEHGSVLTESTFKTTGSIHQVYFPAEVRNARDIGGWKTLDGKTVVYRKLYRGGAVKGLISEAGKQEWRAAGIKAELDLREESSGSLASGVGSDIDYCKPGIPHGYAGMLKDYQPAIRESFEFIAKCLREDKPVFFHCTAGRDRTGTMSMLILGLLGVSDGDISKEYELTYFSPRDWSIWISRDPDNFLHSRCLNGYFNAACNYIWSRGEPDFAGCVEKYLLSIGVNQQDIDDIRLIMLSE